MIQFSPDLDTLTGSRCLPGSYYRVALCMKPDITMMPDHGTAPYYLKEVRAQDGHGIAVMEQLVNCRIGSQNFSERRLLQAVLPLPDKLQRYVKSRPFLDAKFESVGQNSVTIAARGAGNDVYHYTTSCPRICCEAMLALIDFLHSKYRSLSKEEWAEFAHTITPDAPTASVESPWGLKYAIQTSGISVDTAKLAPDGNLSRHFKLPYNRPWVAASTFRLKLTPLRWFFDNNIKESLSGYVPEAELDNLVSKAALLAQRCKNAECVNDYYCPLMDSTGKVCLFLYRLDLKVIPEERFLATLIKQEERL